MIATWLALALPALAREAPAILRSDDSSAYDLPVAAVQRGLGGTATVHDLEGDREVADRIIAELRRDPPPVVVALGAKAAYAARNGLLESQLVYVMVGDPERYGLPGPGVTGVTEAVPPAALTAQLQLFLPDVRRLGVMVSDPDSPGLAALIDAASAASIDVVVALVDENGDARAPWRAIRQEIDALLLIRDPAVLTPENVRYLVDETRRQRVPLLSPTEVLVRVGALMCVAPDHEQAGEQAALLALKILDGTPADTIEPVDPQAWRVVLNDDTLRRLNLEIDGMMLDFVDEVVEDLR